MTIPTRSALLVQVKDLDDTHAWAEFCEMYGGLIRRLALKQGLTEDEADDVMQKVFVGVSRNIGDFQYDRTKCSFKHWLSQMVQWRIRDRLRERLPIEEPHRDEDSTEGCEDDGTESVIPELEAVWDAEWHRNLIEVASDRVRKQVSPKQFQIYYLHILNELPVADVVRRLHVSPAQVYLARLRVGRVFRRVVQTLQEAEQV